MVDSQYRITGRRYERARQVRIPKLWSMRKEMQASAVCLFDDKFPARRDRLGKGGLMWLMQTSLERSKERGREGAGKETDGG